MSESDPPAWARDLLQIWFERLEASDWFTQSDVVDAMLESRFADVLASKGIPHELDVWGHDVPHDWPSWRRQLSHHLPRFC